jgi:hypothetical protein
VPVRLIDRQVRVLLHANDLVSFDGRQQVARHDRLTGRLEAHLELDHCLEALIRKPGALPGATALEQARAAGELVSTTSGENTPLVEVALPVARHLACRTWRWLIERMVLGRR